MREFIKENWGWFLLAILGFGFLLFIASTQERRQVGGVVMVHNVTAGSSGHRTYTTIVKTDDGYVEEETGLNLYVVPVGSRVTIEVTRAKRKK